MIFKRSGTFSDASHCIMKLQIVLDMFTPGNTKNILETVTLNERPCIKLNFYQVETNLVRLTKNAKQNKRFNNLVVLLLIKDHTKQNRFCARSKANHDVETAFRQHMRCLNRFLLDIPIVDVERSYRIPTCEALLNSTRFSSISGCGIGLIVAAY